jgi:hypothetical protein
MALCQSSCVFLPVVRIAGLWGRFANCPCQLVAGSLQLVTGGPKLVAGSVQLVAGSVQLEAQLFRPNGCFLRGFARLGLLWRDKHWGRCAGWLVWRRFGLGAGWLVRRGFGLVARRF